MDSSVEKRVDSYFAYIKSELINNFSDEESLEYIEWSKKIIEDTVKDRKEKEILGHLRTCTDKEKEALKQKKKKYLPKNYPYNLKPGEIIHVNFGFGYCSELSDGHYGLIMSDIVANMYLVLPLSSEPLKLFSSYIEGLELPNKDGILEKKSYLRFDQLRFVHYRRLENIIGCNRKSLGETNFKEVQRQLSEFLKNGVDKTSRVSYTINVSKTQLTQLPAGG